MELVYIFRDREILVQGGGDAAEAGIVASFVSSDIQIRCEDCISGSVGILLRPDAQAPAGSRFEPIASYFFAHDEEENARVAHVKSYCHWRASTRFCPSCGQPLQLHAVEHALECTACGRLVFPRIEPCIITLISRGEEILLLRNVKDTRGVYACLAGFVEMGETLEQALRREVREETGLEVQNIRYAGSQAWPFPDQLMAAFYADYKSGEIRIQESEIADARWFRRDALPPLPKPGSIAWRLINNKF
ncbi:MAG: NAD(+) diphosphatase [Bacteroidales bacterium]|nr:NAD(+) diphosphatase [Bacteroidales bacterium]